jgi:hypothetical protein
MPHEVLFCEKVLRKCFPRYQMNFQQHMYLSTTYFGIWEKRKKKYIGHLEVWPSTRLYKVLKHSCPKAFQSTSMPLGQKPKKNKKTYVAA